ncbi:MAG: hypothetical protein JW932_02660 [Deltaproteobacteria bacterium]|nr:hypothetical protein [Deltaproteobacteria bacterium]
MDKTQERLERWIAAEGINFIDSDAEGAYIKRARRVADAVQLKVPDRVPIELVFGVFPALANGYTAEDILFFEGENTSRLEVIRDIPKGKAVYHFERVDLRKAKEILGDTVCIRGNVPVSLLHTGKPDDVKAYVKNLIDIVGKDGGLIVDSGSIFDEAKHENVKAMVDFTKEYGRYSS